MWSPGVFQTPMAGLWHLCCHAKPTSHQRRSLAEGPSSQFSPLITCTLQSRGPYLPSYTSGSRRALAAAHPQQSQPPAHRSVARYCDSSKSFSFSTKAEFFHHAPHQTDTSPPRVSFLPKRKKSSHEHTEM